MGIVEKKDLIYPELSYQLIGIAYTVSNELGHGHLEKIYQRAFAKELKVAGLNFKEQVPYPVSYKGEIIGRNYLDFLIEDKVIIELKRTAFFSKKNIDQVVNYLRVSGLQLCLLIHFTSDGVRFKRLVNDFNSKKT